MSPAARAFRWASSVLLVSTGGLAKSGALSPPEYLLLLLRIHAHAELRRAPASELDAQAGPCAGPDKQDKLAVVSIERAHWDQWLHGTVGHAETLIGLPEMGCIRHAAADPTRQLALPL